MCFVTVHSIVYYIILLALAGLTTANANCTTGDVRLADGLISNAGRVEICINNAWGTVCDYRWQESSASVVCKQLGFQPYGMFLHMTNEPTVALNIIM